MRRQAQTDTARDDGSSHETRQRLLDAAFAALEEKGLAGCRVADIAQRAGVAPGSIYVHFDDKAALITEALASKGERGTPKLSADLESGVAADALRTTGERLLSGKGTALQRAMLQMWATSLADPASKRRIRSDLQHVQADTAGAYQQLVSALPDPGAAGATAAATADSLDADALATFGMVLMLGSTVAKALDLPLLSERDARVMIAHLGELVARSRPRPSRRTQRGAKRKVAR